MALRHDCYALMGRHSSRLCLVTSDQCLGTVHVCVLVLLSCLLLPSKCGVDFFVLFCFVFLVFVVVVLARVIKIEIACHFSSSE